jgi:hypothetical protein
MVKNHVLHVWMKHIEKSCHYVHDHIKQGWIALDFVQFKGQTTYILIKPISEVGF